MPKCAAYECKNIGVHKFPKDPKRRKLWERNLRRKNWKSTNASRLCSAHFKEDDYYGKNAYTGNEPVKNFLKPSAVPTIFSFTKQETPLARERQSRLEGRCKKRLAFTESIHTSSAEPIPDVGNEIEVEDVHDDNEPQNVIHNVLLDKSTQVNFERECINKYKNDDRGIAFYTGFENYEKFYLVYLTLYPMVDKIKYYGSSVKNLSTEDQFFLTLIKLRRDKCNYELSRFFDISPTTVSNIFITWINFIHQLWSKLNIWPEKDLVQYYMPDSFKQYNSNTRVILDGTEIRVQKPQNPLSQQASWSSYKHSNTLKILVGATPGGLLSYCSKAFAGSISDRQIVERSDLVQMCEPGDCILADRGFNIQDMFANKDVTVNIPTFLKGKSQITGLTVKNDSKLANKRVHIERLIGLMKTYKILKNELHHSYIPFASKIFFVCFMCCNFRESIMKK